MIVLASTSPIRRQLLRQAGLVFKTARPPIDETKIKATLKKAGASAAQVAEKLAEGKAIGVGAILPNAYVIGCDQMMECEGVWFDKPVDRPAARKQLEALRSKTHRLHSASVISHEGHVIWQHVESASLTMRDFSDRFLDSYFEAVSEATLASVGGYQLEGLGVQLFDKIEGDYFTILGIPLLQLLAALRKAGATIA